LTGIRILLRPTHPQTNYAAMCPVTGAPRPESQTPPTVRRLGPRASAIAYTSGAAPRRCQRSRAKTVKGQSWAGAASDRTLCCSGRADALAPSHSPTPAIESNLGGDGIILEPPFTVQVSLPGNESLDLIVQGLISREKTGGRVLGLAAEVKFRLLEPNFLVRDSSGPKSSP
jgi:hypothetical protein